VDFQDDALAHVLLHICCRIILLIVFEVALIKIVPLNFWIQSYEICNFMNFWYFIIIWPLSIRWIMVLDVLVGFVVLAVRYSNTNLGIWNRLEGVDISNINL